MSATQDKLRKRLEHLQKMKRETPYSESVQVSIENITRAIAGGGYDKQKIESVKKEGQES
jgi:hypothetical protein